MRVLHVWNTAGVASVIAKYQAKVLGWDTWVVTRSEFDRFGLTVYGEAMRCGARMFSLRVLLKARGYDVIHIHSCDKILPLLKRLYPRKPLVLHYHGSEVRGKWSAKREYCRLADVVLVSTPDLLDGAPEGVIYLPNPVDTEIFKPMPTLRRSLTAVYLIKHQKGEDPGWAKRVASKLGLRLTVRDRMKDPIPYPKLPRFLNSFEYYIDRNYVPSLSKTALEALACGLKVIRWDERTVEGLPEEHRPEKVVSTLAEIYEYLKR